MPRRGPFKTWFYTRMPIHKFWQKHYVNYLAPKNLNFWYVFGSLSIVALVMQVVSGFFLTMFYIPTEEQAFNSINNIMQKVNYGWFIRYMHTTGASALFIVIYLHIYRSIMYGSYKYPRELLWVIGVTLYVAILAEGFTGYALPWGQMSFWATSVILKLFGTIPLIGKQLVIWLQGGDAVTGITLHRMFAFHVILFPLIIIILTLIHISSLHYVGSNNPLGIDTSKKDCINYHPYYTAKNLVGIVIFLIIFALVMFYKPSMHGFFIEPTNNIPADSLKSPENISPAWYLTPYYSILRAVPHKFFGAVAMASAIAFLFILPWLDKSPVRSIHYKGTLSKIALLFFVVSFLGLGYLGTLTPTPINIALCRILSLIYFLYFILMPYYTSYEKAKITPKRISQ